MKMKKKSTMENLENIALNFEKMNDDYIFMKEKLVEFDVEEYDKININFRECHVAIAKNGGLIAICKKKGFLDITRGSKINNYIVVTYQNAKKRYLIPIDWNYKERWVIDLEFNEKEQLYAICNDGTIFKIDILTQRAAQKKSSEFFKNQPIIKAKLVENGFIALTVDNNFVYAKDIKDPIPKILFPISLLGFSSNVDFLAIPPSKSKSKKLELLITNEKGDGLIHIEETEGDGQFSLIPVEGTGQMECKGASIIIKNRVETYYINVEENKEPEIPEPGTKYEKLGKIAALAISPKKDQIAIYDPRGIVFFFYSTFEEGGERRKALVQLNEEYNSDELYELINVLNFEEGCQFLYCGEDAVAIVGYRYIFIVNTLSKPLIFKITDEEKVEPNPVLCKCISEVDGLRFLTNEGVFFISRVSKELADVCYPFSNNPSINLLKAYQSSLDKETNSEKKIRDIKNNLADAIYNLQIAAGNIIWNKNGGKEEQEKKEGQLFLLEAAQHAKCFVKKEEFNFDKFYERCKHIRTVNNLRNHSNKPKLITYNEYINLPSSKDLILKLMRSLNFGIAFKICQYLEEDIKFVYEKYAIACLKKMNNSFDLEEETKTFELLNEKLKTVKNFSYIKLAKKAFKYHKDVIGLKFLENEKSLLAKLPKYIDKEEWDKVFELSENIIDTNILMSIIDKAFKKTTLSDFIQIAGRHPGLKTSMIEFLIKNAPEKLDDYMKLLKSPEELFFFALEQYFQSPKYTDRLNYISMARENQKLIDNSINPNFEHKFYKSYLDSLESNLTLKIDILNLDTTVIPKPDDTSFDISVYDTLKYSVKANKINWVDSQNKKFGLSPEGMNIMKLMAYGENAKFGEIEVMIKKNNLKKLNLTNLNLAEIYYKFKGYKEATEYIKNITEPFYFEYKIDMLKHMEMNEAALEVIISDKNIENMSDFVNEIIGKKPKLLRKAKEFAEKYKVVLNLEQTN